MSEDQKFTRAAEMDVFAANERYRKALEQIGKGSKEVFVDGGSWKGPLGARHSQIIACEALGWENPA